MNNNFSFKLKSVDKKARTGVISTPRGNIRTPAFMPVGTAGSVKAMIPENVTKTGADILLGNTYHLMLRPGSEIVAKIDFSSLAINGNICPGFPKSFGLVLGSINA